MAKQNQQKDEKSSELVRLHNLVLASIDYQIELYKSSTLNGFNPILQLENLKHQTQEQFEKGQVSKLKQLFRNLTEMPIESRDIKFNDFIQNETGYNIDIFEEYFKRIDKILEKGHISTDSQFYDINSMVDYLCHKQPVDKDKIDKLNLLLTNYEQRKIKKQK